MSNFYGDEYAKVVWRAEDIKKLKPNWSLEKCEEWLEDNQENIQDRLTETGWDLIEGMLVIERQNWEKKNEQ